MCATCTFTQMTDRHARTADDCHYADIQDRWLDLSTCAAGIVPTRLPLQPTPGEIEMIGDDLRTLARKVDALIVAYGNYVDTNTSGIDHALFENVLFNALDGNALYEIERASQQFRDDSAQCAYYAPHNCSLPD